VTVRQDNHAECPDPLPSILSHFTKVGRYILGMDPEPAPEFEVLATPQPDDHVVYALVHGDRFLYVGKSEPGGGKVFTERLEWYGRRRPTWDEKKSATETRNRLLLTCVLLQAQLDHDNPEPVEAWVFRPQPVVIMGLSVFLEAGLESALKPFAEWNKKGGPKNQVVIQQARREIEALVDRLRGG